MTDPDTPTDDNSDDQRPSFLELTDWIDGRLTRSRAADIAAQVESGDTETVETAEWIEGFFRFGQQNPLPVPPAIVRQRLRQSFQRHNGRELEIERKSAELSFDSRDDAVLAGVRGGFEVEDGYRLAFAADSLGVLVDVLPGGPGTVRLDGQVLTANPEAPVWNTTVDHPEGTLQDIGGDGQGCFSIDDVPLDATRLVLSNGLMEIEILEPLGRPEQ
ncbi:MAG: hypothetical protein ACRBK7_12240 [Acidimicrobiales bacterium]